MRRGLRRIAVACGALLALGAILAAGNFAVNRLRTGIQDHLWALEGQVDQLSRLSQRNAAMRQRGREVPHYQFRYDWMGGEHLIAHAMGGLEGRAYTNSLEAFHHSYDLGYRIFEVDMALTPEGALVLTHNGAGPYDEFMRGTGEYTRLDIRDLIALMREYPEIVVITDTKYAQREEYLLQFTRILEAAGQADASILQRIVPQVYSVEMLHDLMALYPFSSVIYTLYYTAIWNIDSVLDVCRETGLGFITFPCDEKDLDVIAPWKEAGIHVATHTVNDPRMARRLLDMGLDMIYTDDLNPADFR